MSNYANYGSVGYDESHTAGVDNVRFSHTSDTVGTNIFTINSGSTTLERILKQIGTTRDKPGLRDSIHATQQKTNSVIMSTTHMIRQLSNQSRRGDKQQRLRAERLRNEFQDSVQRYTSLQRQMADKIRTSYSYTPMPAIVQENHAENTTTEKTSLLEEEAKQTFEQQQILKDIEFEQALIEERDQRMRQVEEDILDVNDIFRSLGAVVHEQGEVINTIEANVDRTFSNVESGRSQLTKAAEYQKKFRQKLCCLTVFLAIVGAVLTVVIVLSMKR